MRIAARGGLLPALVITTVLALTPLAPVRAQAPDTTATGPADEERPLPALHLDRALHGGAMLAGLLAFDESFRRGIQGVDAAATDELADRAEWFGDWDASLPFIAGGALGIGGLTEGERGLKQGIAVLVGTLAGSTVNETINRAVGRSRPYWDEGVLTFRPFSGHASFPSGHTAFVFGVAGGIDAVTDGWAPAAAAYGVAGLTGLSRAYHDRHWLTDVAAGAAIGLLVSRHVTARVARALGADAPADSPADAPADAPADPAAASMPTAPRASLRPAHRSPTLRLLATPTFAGVQLRF